MINQNDIDECIGKCKSKIIINSAESKFIQKYEGGLSNN